MSKTSKSAHFTLFFVFVFSLSSQVSRAFAQAQNGQAQCMQQFGWMSNSLGQSPCDVVALAASACTAAGQSEPSMPALAGSSQNYPGPTTQTASDCTCSSVTYSLLSACAYCQGGSPGLWSDYTSQCAPNEITNGGYSHDIPVGTAFPAWAYTPMLSGSDQWDPSNAQLIASEDLPESTPGAAPTATDSPTSSRDSSSTKKSSSPTSTKATTIRPTSSSTLLPKPSSSSTSTKRSSTTKIAAAVGAGVGGLAILSGIIWAYRYFTQQAAQNDVEQDGSGNYNGSGPTDNNDGTSSPFDEKYFPAALTPNSGNPLMPPDNVYDPFKTVPQGSGDGQNQTADPNQYISAAIHLAERYGPSVVKKFHLPS